MKTFCGYFDEGKCQSCGLISTEYPEQLKLKENRLLKHLEKFESFQLLPSQASNTTHFRNKAKLVVTGTIENPIIGLGGNEELDLGREILNCSLHHPFINSVLNFMPDFIRLTLLPPYQIKDKKGELKGIIVYYSEDSQESYLRFILRSKESLDRIKKHLPSLVEKFPEITCISANIQPIPHAILEGDEEVFLSEKKFINHHIKNFTLRLGPQGFVQTNHKVARALYETAAKWTEELQIEKFSELFCGQGAFSFFVAQKVKSSIGFEINAEAVNEANRTASTLGYDHLKFACADAANVSNELRKYGPDLVLVNPPRRGLSGAIEIFKDEIFEHIIYSSCSIESLAKDLEELAPFYKVIKVQIFDMFPHTHHFETLLLLRRI